MNNTMVHLIGVDGSGRFSNQDLELIRSCRALVLSRRHQSLLSSTLASLPETCLIPIAPVQQALTLAAQALNRGDVAVLASGDPLFFGIGRTLLNFFGPERIAVYPALSSMQVAFARFKIPWDDAGFLSLHGREVNNIAATLLGHDKLFLFTDHRTSPDLIARSLLQECGTGINTEYTVHVAENLGMDKEQLHSGSLSEIAARTFAPLNVMILIKRSPPSSLPTIGLIEEEITHSRGLITKNEVRAASLHALRLPLQGVLWDVGAGSGAVGLEAARLFPRLQVCAVEQKDEQIQNIRRNRERFQAWNLHLLQGNAPEILAALPAPDRVFIGGSGGQLRAIIDHAASRLTPGGRIVVNAVLEKTAQEAPEYLHAMGLKVTMSEIRVTRRRYPHDSPLSLDSGMVKEQTALDNQVLHPITIIVGQK